MVTQPYTAIVFYEKWEKLTKYFSLYQNEKDEFIEPST